jgi:hypothetical protein
MFGSARSAALRELQRQSAETSGQNHTLCMRYNVPQAKDYYYAATPVLPA